MGQVLWLIVVIRWRVDHHSKLGILCFQDVYELDHIQAIRGTSVWREETAATPIGKVGVPQQTMIGIVFTVIMVEK